MLLADSVAGAADLMVAPLIGVVVPVILETDRIENQVGYGRDPCLCGW